MHGNAELITEVLKDQMGFGGFVISDWEGIDQTAGRLRGPTRTGPHGVNAGIDMIMEPNNYQGFIPGLTDEVTAGRVTKARVDDAVSRILTEKFKLGLFEHPYTDRTHIGDVGSAAHRAVARGGRRVAGAAQERRGKLPVPRSKGLRGRQQRQRPGQPDRRLDAHLAGRLDEHHHRHDDPRRDPQRSREGPRHVQRGRLGARSAGHVGVVVVGEKPYAEGIGDVGEPPWAYDARLTTASRARSRT